MTWAAVAVGGSALVGGAISYMGGQQAAGAASQAAGKQADIAQSYQNMVEANKKQAQDLIGGAISPSQMAEYDRALQSQERVVQRQESLANNLSPTLIDAGKQLGQLLQGQSAPVLQNIQNQRQLQRQNLINQLNANYGPNAVNSSVGQQQLQQFDAESANMMSNAQQSYIQQLSGMSLEGGQSLVSSGNAANSMLSNMNMQNPMTQTAYKQADSLAAFSGQQGYASQMGMQAAQTQSVGAALQAQNMVGLGKGIASLGGQLAGAGLFKQQPAAQPQAMEPQQNQLSQYIINQGANNPSEMKA